MTIVDLITILSMMQAQMTAPSVPARWYSVFASSYRGRCGYAVTDVVGMSAKQLRKQISDGYDRRNGFFVIVTSGTPSKCSQKAIAVVTKLGFASVIVRSEQDADR